MFTCKLSEVSKSTENYKRLAVCFRLKFFVCKQIQRKSRVGFVLHFVSFSMCASSMFIERFFRSPFIPFFLISFERLVNNTNSYSSLIRFNYLLHNTSHAHSLFIETYTYKQNFQCIEISSET